jgi:hypothetical protein
VTGSDPTVAVPPELLDLRASDFVIVKVDDATRIRFEFNDRDGKPSHVTVCRQRHGDKRLDTSWELDFRPEGDRPGQWVTERSDEAVKYRAAVVFQIIDAAVGVLRGRVGGLAEELDRIDLEVQHLIDAA